MRLPDEVEPMIAPPRGSFEMSLAGPTAQAVPAVRVALVGTVRAGYRGHEAAMTLLFRDPIFLEHDTGRHPECAARLKAVAAKLTDTGFAERCAAGHYQPLTAEDVVAVHPKEMIDRART